MRIVNGIMQIYAHKTEIAFAEVSNERYFHIKLISVTCD